MNIVYLNGEFVPQSQAKVSVMDRGFLFGDGVYEVVPVFEGKMFGFDEHIKRLDNSLKGIGMSSPKTHEQWHELFQTLLDKNSLSNETLNIYLQITRGTDSTRNHLIPLNLEPTIVAFCTPSKVTPRHEIEQGFSAITLDDSRRRDCHIKAITLLPNILLYDEAKKAGAIEAILIRNGYAIECTSSNLFVIKAGEIMTPPLNNQILPGITRSTVINIAKDCSIPCHEQNITEAELLNADEIWVTGSSKEICPIVTLNKKPVGDGKVGPLWHRVMVVYDELTRQRTHEQK